MADAEDVPSILLPCAICARTFAPQSLEKHIKICERSAIKKRKPFDSAKQRIQGTELEEFLPKQENKRLHQEDRIGKSKTSWKQTHDEFLRAIRAARGEPIEVPVKQTPNHVTSGAPTRANEKGTCPSCNRQFGIKAYDRHVAWCKERTTRVQLSPATNLAKERLEARIRYRAPALKNRRPTIREKYMPGSTTNLGCTAKNSPSSNAMKARESVSLPSCNKGNDSPAKQKPAVRKPGQSRDSISTGPLKSRPMDRVTRPVEDLQYESPRSRTSFLPSSSKHPVPLLNPGKFTNSSVMSNANYLSKFDSRAVRDPISQSKNDNLSKTQKLNIVSARSYGNPKLNDMAVNNDKFGLTIQPCCIHQEHEFVTWKQISRGKFESTENLDFKDNLVSKLNLLSLRFSQDQEQLKKVEKSKIDDVLNKSSLNENELFEGEVDLDLRTTTWMSRVRKLDQTYLIKENIDDNLDTEFCVSETLKPLINDPEIIKDIPGKTSCEINSGIFIINPDEPRSEELPAELDSPTRFNDKISFTSTPLGNRSNKIFGDENSESSKQINVDFTENVLLNIKVEDMIENESLSLEDLDTGKREKNSGAEGEREELLKEENQKNIKRREKKILKNQIDSARVLDFSTSEFHLNEDNLNNERIEVEKNDEDENKSSGVKETELFSERKEKLSSGRREELSSRRREELSSGRREELSSRRREELSSGRREELSLESGEETSSSQTKSPHPIEEISSPHSSSDSAIQNIEKKDSSRQRSGTYIIEKPFIRLPKHNRSTETCSIDFQLQEPLQKRRRTEEDIENFNNDDKNLKEENLSLNTSLNSKFLNLMNESKLNLEKENVEVQFSGLKLNQADVKNEDELENIINAENFTEISLMSIKSEPEIFDENSFHESKLLNKIDHFSESASDQTDAYEVRAEDSLESIVTRTKNLKINDEESNSGLQLKEEFENTENIAELKRNTNENNYSKSLDFQKSINLEKKESEISEDEDKKLQVEKFIKIKEDFIKTNKEKEKSFIKNNNEERKKFPFENKIEPLLRSNIPRQISKSEIKLNTSDQFWKKRKKKEEIPNFQNNLLTSKNDLQPKSSLQPSRRKETISLSLPENRIKTEEIDIIEFNSKEEKNTCEDNSQIIIADPNLLFHSKSLSSFIPHELESIKLNSAKLEKKIHRSLNLLRGSTDTLISSVEDIETTSKTPSMVDFFIDETCTIEEIQTPHGSTSYKLLPIIETDSSNLEKKEFLKNNPREESYWKRASRISMRRLIGSEAVKAEGEFKLTKRNPRVCILPPVAYSASGKVRFILPDRPAWNNYVRRHPDFFMVLRGRIGSNKTYDPYLMAEQQMRDLLSDTSDISSTDGTSTQPNSTPNENSTHYPLTHSSAFVKYPPQTLPTPIDPSKKRASLIAPPSQFDDLTSDFSSDCTETNSISQELFVNDLLSQTRNSVANSTNKEKSPSRDHILGRRVIIDKSKALGSDIEDSSRGRSSVGSVEKSRKILEKVSGSKIIRPMVNRSHSVRAASAPKIPERKNSSSSESSGSQKKCMKTSKSSDSSLADRSNNNHSNNNSSSCASTMNGSNLSLNSIVSSEVDIKRSNSMFDELMSSFEEDSSTILPSLRSLLKSDPLSMSSPIQSNKRNGQVSDDELSSPDSYKRQDHSKLSADSAYSSLNRKYYNHGRSTNDMGSRLDEDPQPRCREGDSRFLSKCKMSKFCHECGSKFPESAKFCCECGVKRLTL